jgi:hypothetical protein
MMTTLRALTSISLHSPAGLLLSALALSACANEARSSDSGVADEPDARGRVPVASWDTGTTDAGAAGDGQGSDSSDPALADAGTGARDTTIGMDATRSTDVDATARDVEEPLDEETCELDDDCDSGEACFILVPGQPGSCLARCLQQSDCSPGADCVLLSASGVDAERFCINRPDTSCSPCETSAQCGGGLCVSLLDGDFCAPVCATDADCLSDEVCEAASDGSVSTDVCVPRAGFCSACLDVDGDLHGEGDCLGLDCNDLNGLVNDSAPELCDGVDNDCDGDTDEGFDLSADQRNCGRCGNVCATPDDGASVSCQSGACVVEECPEGYFDGNSLITDGCEARLNSCGGESPLAAEPGIDCGECGQVWVCDGAEAVVCSDSAAAANACGGCVSLSAVPGDPCGYRETGVVTCDGPERTRCQGEPVAMVVADSVEFNAAYWRLNNGDPIESARQRGSLVARVLGAPTAWHNQELPVTEINDEGWIVFHFPRPYVSGLAPHIEHASCRGTGIEGLPFRFTMRDASLPASDAGSWMLIDMNEPFENGLFYVGKGDDGNESYTLAASYVGGEWQATGRRLSGDTPDSCAYDREP